MASNNGSDYQRGTTAAPQMARAVLADVRPQVMGSFNDAASLVVGSGASGVTYSSVARSATGNSITVAHVVSGTNTALSVSVSGNAITVNLATDGGGAATSTANQVVAAVNGNGPAAALVTAAASGAGTGVAAAIAATALSGGKSVTFGGVSNAPLPRIPPIHVSYN